MWRFFQSLLFQAQCPLCQRPTQAQFCRDCTAQILSHRSPNPGQRWQDDSPRWVWGQYDGQLRRAITTMKFEQRPDIGVWLGEQLGEQWLAQSFVKSLPKPAVVPIPLHGAKQQQRGFNQAESIAAGFCRLTGYPLYPQALQRIKNTQALFDLSPGDRQRELQSALQVGRQFMPQRPWLILDDIVTTGSTAQEAKLAIEQQGGKVLGLVAIAAPPFLGTMELRRPT